MKRAFTIALLAVSTSASAQNVIAVRAPVVQTTVLPGAKFAVPVVLDMTNVTGQSIGILTLDVNWNPAAMTLDSLRSVAPLSILPNSSNIPGGQAFLSVRSSAGVTGGVTTVANMYFTAGPAGGTHLRLTPAGYSPAAGGSLTAMVVPTDVDVCSELSGMWGDANGDANVNIIDAQQIARFSVGLAVANQALVAGIADVTADNAVNIIDAQQVARFSVGLTAAPRVNAALPNSTYVPTSLSITGSNINVAPTEQMQLLATPQNAQSAPLTGCSPVSWSSSNPAVATITPSGFLVGGTPGTATITATSGSAQGTTNLVVSSSSSFWTGAVSSAWTTQGNWTAGVPGANTSAAIPPGTVNAPDISAPASMLFLTVQTGASITVTSSSLTTSGLTNFGTLSALSSTLNGPVDNKGLVRALGNVSITGTLLSGGSIRVLSTSALGAGALTLANGYTNTGLLELTDSAGFCCIGSSLTVTSGVLAQNGAGVIWTTQGTQPSGRTINAALDNNGQISVQASGGLTIVGPPGTVQKNRGYIVLGGNLTFVQDGFINTGTLLMNGRSMIFNQSAGATTSLGGTVDFTPGGGRLTVNGGALDVASNTMFWAIGTIATVGATVTLPATSLTFYNNVALSLGSSTAAGGTLTIPAGQTLTLVSGTSLQSPIDNQGTLRINGTVSLNALQQSTSAAVLNITLGGTAPSQYDQLAIVGTATLGGTLNVTTANGFTPAPGDTFTIMTYSGASIGAFTTLNLPSGCSANPSSGQLVISC